MLAVQLAALSPGIQGHPCIPLQEGRPHGFEGQEEEQPPRQWAEKRGLSPAEKRMRVSITEEILSRSHEAKEGKVHSDLQDSVTAALE